MSDSPQTPTPTSKKGLGAWLGLAGILLAAIALVLAFLSWKNCQTLKQATNTANVSHAVESENLHNNISQLQTNLAATQDSLSHFMRSVGNTEQQNTLSQVTYLINLANLQLSIAHDATASLRLLVTAQSKIESLNDPRFFALNKTLVADIGALKNTPKFNITHIISQIETLNHNIEIFSLMPNKADLKKSIQQTEKALTNKTAPSNETWYKRFWHHLSGVKDLIVIRRTNANLMPLLNTEQQAILKATLQGKLLLVEYAAIKHNNALYQQLLLAAQNSVTTYYFDSDNRTTLQTQLSTLQKINVGPKTPDISNTLTVLNQTLGNMVQTNNPAPHPIKALPKLPSSKTGVAI